MDTKLRLFVVTISLCNVFSIANIDLDVPPDVTLKNYVCNGGKYKDGDLDLADVMFGVVANVVTQTPLDPDYDYFNREITVGEIAYGHGKCNGRLEVIGCNACLNIAMEQLSKLCGNSVGAWVQLGDCRIRYEQYPFDDKE